MFFIAKANIVGLVLFHARALLFITVRLLNLTITALQSPNSNSNVYFQRRKNARKNEAKITNKEKGLRSV